MPHRTLHDKREEMIQFLLENIVGREIERIGNDIEFKGSADRKFFIKTLSKQAEFPYRFDDDPKHFDNDRRRLQAISNSISFFVQGKNTLGYIPGFVLLQADTDFSQLKDRTQPLVNEGYFLKQKIDSEAHYDERILDPIEVALYQFYHHNTRNSGKKRGIRGLTYFPELIYFNPKKGIVEVVSFAHVTDPCEFKDDNCPVCEKPNRSMHDHQPCKAGGAYVNYAKKRGVARYEKNILISRTRRIIDSTCQIEAEKGVRFMPAELSISKLTLPSEQYLAVVK
ncbi:hypothetical protein CEE44_00210 [Candidatus Woesearchaeota archaeon B3_Woes]|nr:MAG: hypothetical protein CEE44_00210 [Candidatus Woesearchaeota archaeon B3_Woes]